jgi:hypothetical protein
MDGQKKVIFLVQNAAGRGWFKMSFTDQMGSLRNTLNDTKKRTNQAVKNVKRDADKIVRGAQAIVAEYAQTQKANAKKLREDLRFSTQNLVRDVKEIRGDNIRSQTELKRDLASAQNVFWGKQKKQEKKEKEGKE